MRSKTIAAALTLLVAAAVSAGAQGTQVQVTPIPCLPLEGNTPVNVTLSPDSAGAEVRVYFRRLSIEVEDFYYVTGRPSGAGSYWAVLPDPEDRKLTRKDLENNDEYAWAKWWRAKETLDSRDPNPDLDEKVIRERASLGKLEKREWMNTKDDPTFQKWLEQLQNEPAEIFVAVYDPYGRQIARSELFIVEVKKEKECPVTLTPQQDGYASNLTVGETKEWQAGEAPFHWECDGLVTRVDPRGILRADEACRACVVAWWGSPLVIPAAMLTTVGIITVLDDDPPEVSPSRP